MARKTFYLVAIITLLLSLTNTNAQQFEYVGFDLAHSRIGTWGIQKELAGQMIPATLSSLAGGETATGTLLSQPFTLQSPKIKILLRGWSGPPNNANDKNYIALIDANTNQILRKAKPPQKTEIAEWVQWDTQDLINHTVQFQLTDNDNHNAYAWFAVDAIDTGKNFNINFNAAPSLDGWKLKDGSDKTQLLIADHHGIPYLDKGEAILQQGKKTEIPLDVTANRIFLFGMTNTMDIGALLWWFPTDYSTRFWVGDKLGEIQINYQDKTTETYPLIIGENIWWGNIFHKFPEPFLSKPEKMQVLRDSMHLFPADPVTNSTRLAFIKPQPKKISSIALIDSPQKQGVPRLKALTAEILPNQTLNPKNTTALPQPKPTNQLTAFLANQTNAMLPEGKDKTQRQKRLNNICNALYTTEENFPKSVPLDIPEGYRGPTVKFEGTIYTDVLTNVFYHNLHQMDGKADPSGIFRESTKNSASFGQYLGFGTYHTGHAPYWNDAWSRGVGNELQVIGAYGYYDKMLVCIDYCFRQARLWNDPDNDKLKINGHPIPPHWCRNIANPVVGKHLGVFENDGHGLIMLSVYNAWKRLPNAKRDQWLKQRWTDVEYAAEWILWQFENPEISGATKHVLLTDSECVYNSGYGLSYGHSLYADFPCMQGLLAFAKMADSIGKEKSAQRWRDRAEKMRIGMEKHFITGGTEKDKPKVWKLWDSGWAYQSANLAPTAFVFDTQGLDPSKGNPDWKLINLATYKRLVDKWSGKAIVNDPWWFEPHEIPIYSRPQRHFPPKGNYGIAMGYGQGLITHTALMLDQMRDVTDNMRWTAKIIYYADYEPYIVPEGVETHPTGKMWFRTGDLGNGQQQSDIMKALRIIIGVDDADPATLKLIPRMPRDWEKISVSQFPAWLNLDGDRRRISIDYTLTRKKDKMKMTLKTDRPLENAQVRFGPFDRLPQKVKVKCNDKILKLAPQPNGDSLWVWVTLPKGNSKFNLEIKGKLTNY